MQDTQPRGALGDMIRDSWSRGRRTGFLEGLVVGFIAACVLLYLRWLA